MCVCGGGGGGGGLCQCALGTPEVVPICEGATCRGELVMVTHMVRVSHVEVNWLWCHIMVRVPHM